ASVLHAHPGTIGVGQTQGARPDVIDVVVENVIPLTGHLVDAVHVRRAQEVSLVYGQVFWFAINLACTGKDNLDTGIVFAACLENGELGRSIDLKIGVRILHGIHVARLTGQIEEVVLSLHQVAHTVFVANVRDVDADTISDVVNIKEIAAVFRNQAVNERDLSAEVDQMPGQIGADEAEAAGDEHSLSHEGTH